MKKVELVESLRTECNLTRIQAQSVVDNFFDIITNTLGRGDRVEIRGFCSFFVKRYRAYTGRNPKNGKKVKVRAKKLPFFKCGKELKERLNHR